MKIFTSLEQLTTAADPQIAGLKNNPKQLAKVVRDQLIDQLIATAVFAGEESLKEQSKKVIHELASLLGIFSASIYPLYQAFGKEEVKGFTVPAINIRTLTYDTSQIIFSLMQKKQIGPVVFEIARSEIEYTLQRPSEYTACVLAAAIKTGYQGPVFLQGDHYQFSQKKYALDKGAETQRIEQLIDESLAAQFYNIDIDASTLVDLAESDLRAQQQENSQATAHLTNYIRQRQPKNMTISIGGEIGHIGGKNSSPEDFVAFMENYQNLIKVAGISKVSVQTGTSHGGIPLADGSMAQVALDFSVLEKVGKVARQSYQIGGAVQHGASTLPNSLFHKFPQVGTLEIHLATGFQNIVYDTMPENFKQTIYSWIKTNLKDEWKTDMAEEQFIYKTRKKALGPFKKELWSLSSEEKQPILKKLEEQLSFLFEQLAIFNTRSTLDKYVSATN